MTKVINLWGGPGAGKSTIASDLFSILKRQGISCELIPEAAKDVVHENHFQMFENQIQIFADQYRRLWRTNNKYEYLIVDSPVLMGVSYAPENYFSSFTPLVRDVFHSFTNLNFFVERVAPYDPVGRYQDEEGANLKAQQIKNFLDDEKILYFPVKGDHEAAFNIMHVLGMTQLLNIDRQLRLFQEQ